MSDLRVPDLNHVFIAGRLTRDLELRYTANNKAWCRFGIANTRYFKDGSGERKEDTTFVDVIVWDAQAEYVSQKLGKGRPVLVEGSLKTNEWQDRESGQKRSKTEINARRVTPLDWDQDRETKPQATGYGRQPEPEQQPLPDDDIPF